MSADEMVHLTTDQDEELTPESWHCADLGSVEFCLERMAAAKAEIDETEAMVAQAVARVKAEGERLTKRLVARLAYFESEIITYANAHRDELLKGGKSKSRKLLGGTVGWRKAGGKLVVKDEEALLEWARAQGDPELLHVKVTVSKSAVNARFDATGEVPPGCDLEEETERAYVKPNADLKLPGGVDPPKALP